jgi:Domain of unknown function (DUF4157)
MAYALASKSKGATPATVAPVRRNQRGRHGGPAGNGRGAGSLARPRIAASAPMPFLQPKLEVGAPNDRFEQEAERVAEQVMRMPASAALPAVSTAAGGAQRSIQRICAECAKEEMAPLQRKPLPNAAAARISARSDAMARSAFADEPAVLQRQEIEEDEMLQTKAAAGVVPTMAPDLEAGIHALRGRGQPLSAAERAFFEPRFGHDFSQVRLHTDARATALARAVEARAFTVGTDIVFGAGQYAQGSEVGKKLLAHELTHTVQQGDSRVVQRLTISPIVNKINPSWTCGQHMRHWKFELSNPAPAEGYMVQEIDYRLNLQGCPNSGLGKFELKEHFWEAWRHISGSRLDVNYKNYTDQSSRPPDSGKIGQVKNYGTVKFFLKSVTGDLDTAWSTSAVPMSQGLPALNGPTPPSWWNDPPVEGPETREAGADWQCCGLPTDFNRPFGRP